QIAKGKFDVILSDIAMPNFDGYQMLEYIREKNINIPVIFLSGHTSPEDEARGLSLGAADYIRKPIDRNLLLARIQRVFKNHAG
ncbi:MAG: response regulator, partial [Bacteroidales bacterium]|nr:response regulator [Bacteroidales bacterium]